ncbi:hypothetical protein TNCV_3316641 [Trichonephila clavipes]|nr:hypothetical protein TNCV_3316641 [Trichonephila clavipes]
MDGEDGPLHPYYNPHLGDVKKICRAHSPKECIFDSIDPHNVPVIEIIIPMEEPDKTMLILSFSKKFDETTCPMESDETNIPMASDETNIPWNLMKQISHGI